MAALNKRVRDYNLNCPVFAQMLFFDPVEEALSEKGKEFLGGPVLCPPLVCSVCVQVCILTDLQNRSICSCTFLYILIPFRDSRVQGSAHIPHLCGQVRRAKRQAEAQHAAKQAQKASVRQDSTDSTIFEQAFGIFWESLPSRVHFLNELLILLRHAA